MPKHSEILNTNVAKIIPIPTIAKLKTKFPNIEDKAIITSIVNITLHIKFIEVPIIVVDAKSIDFRLFESVIIKPQDVFFN